MSASVSRVYSRWVGANLLQLLISADLPDRNVRLCGKTITSGPASDCASRNSAGSHRDGYITGAALYSQLIAFLMSSSSSSSSLPRQLLLHTVSRVRSTSGQPAALFYSSTLSPQKPTPESKPTVQRRGWVGNDTHVVLFWRSLLRHREMANFMFRYKRGFSIFALV